MYGSSAAYFGSSGSPNADLQRSLSRFSPGNVERARPDPAFVAPQGYYPERPGYNQPPLDLSLPAHKRAPPDVPTITPSSGSYVAPFQFVLGVQRAPPSVAYGALVDGALSPSARRAGDWRSPPRGPQEAPPVEIFYSIEDMASGEQLTTMAAGTAGTRVQLPVGSFKIRAQCGSGYAVGPPVVATFVIRQGGASQLSSEILSHQVGKYSVGYRGEHDTLDDLFTAIGESSLTADAQQAHDDAHQHSVDTSPQRRMGPQRTPAAPRSLLEERIPGRVMTPPASAVFDHPVQLQTHHHYDGDEGQQGRQQLRHVPLFRPSPSSQHQQVDANASLENMKEQHRQAQPDFRANEVLDFDDEGKEQQHLASPRARHVGPRQAVERDSGIAFVDPPPVIAARSPFDLRVVLPPRGRWMYLFGSAIAATMERDRTLNLIISTEIPQRAERHSANSGGRGLYSPSGTRSSTSPRGNGNAPTITCVVLVVTADVAQRRQPVTSSDALVQFCHVAALETGSEGALRCSLSASRHPINGGGIAITRQTFGPALESQFSGLSFVVDNLFSGVVALRTLIASASPHRNSANAVAAIEDALSGSVLPALQFEWEAAQSLPARKLHHLQQQGSCTARLFSSSGPIVSADSIDVRRGDRFALYFDQQLSHPQNGPECDIELVFSHNDDPFYRFPVPRAVVAAGSLAELSAVVRLVADEYLDAADRGVSRAGLERTVSNFVALSHVDEVLAVVHDVMIPPIANDASAVALDTGIRASGTKASQAIVRCSIAGSAISAPAFTAAFREAFD